jgi:hypothetical protein
MSLIHLSYRLAFDADAATDNSAQRRERIGHQIDSLAQRASTLLPDHPAQKGVERTFDRLNVEFQAED